MSLEGSLETIALPDVLTLLATTGKTGELKVNGANIDGRLWVRDGELVASSAGHAATHLDVVFQLLRLPTGTFSFDADGVPDEAGEPATVAPLLVEAASRLVEWREIEAVIPSLSAVISMASEAPEPEVIVRADQWLVLVATRGGRPVQDVIDSVGLGEFDGCKSLKELADAQLIRVDEAPPVVVESPPTAAIDPVVPSVLEPTDAVHPSRFEPMYTSSSSFGDDNAAVASAEAADGEEAAVEGADVDHESEFASPYRVGAYDSADDEASDGAHRSVFGAADSTYAMGNGRKPAWSPEVHDGLSAGDPSAEPSALGVPDEDMVPADHRWGGHSVLDPTSATEVGDIVFVAPEPEASAEVDAHAGDEADHSGHDSDLVPVAAVHGGAETGSVAPTDGAAHTEGAVGAEGATVSEGPPEADGAAPADDEPINRGLLLKFLSSVRT